MNTKLLIICNIQWGVGIALRKTRRLFKYSSTKLFIITHQLDNSFFFPLPKNDHEKNMVIGEAERRSGLGMHRKNSCVTLLVDAWSMVSWSLKEAVGGKSKFVWHKGDEDAVGGRTQPWDHSSGALLIFLGPLPSKAKPQKYQAISIH